MPAFYYNNLKSHNLTSTNEIVGTLAHEYGKYHLDLKNKQTKAWAETIDLVKTFYNKLESLIPNLGNWGILYEYKIPRRAKRIDAVMLSNNAIFVVEVKFKSKKYQSQDIAQVEDYCLDLRDFHFESNGSTIVPILLCTEAQELENDFSPTDDLVQEVLFANKHNFSDVIKNVALSLRQGNLSIDPYTWEKSMYSPTPTIIEAAQTLYARQSVTEISRNHAGAENLSITTSIILDAIKQAQENKSKIICFLTGVPGAGKTLVGLNIVHNRDFRTTERELGVFLSGNSPLIKVLSEALARDYAKRERETVKEARRKVKTFIHNVHEFIDDYYHDNNKKPVDRVLIYDEAQRAWTKEHKSKKSKGEINESEPEILLSIMNRFPDWSVIIALVGGGQEINTGEAGLREWGKAIEEKYYNWNVFISPELKQGDHSTGNLTLFDITPLRVNVIENENLHLKVSIRSYRAQALSRWVSLVLDNKNKEAEFVMNTDLKQYPAFITRDLELAKNWLKRKARGSRRTGIVASSGGRRLKAFGYDPYYGLRGNSKQNELGAWYLNPPSDVRSSNFLEILSTEYAVQGLEIDWVGLLWDADLRRGKGDWDFRKFQGTTWQQVSDEQKRQFILNKYRVLMTRGREGLVIWVPMGDEDDQTRLPKIYDDLYYYLKTCGMRDVTATLE